jgi:hypothetical protein
MFLNLTRDNVSGRTKISWIKWWDPKYYFNTKESAWKGQSTQQLL